MRLTVPADYTPTVGLGCRSGGYAVYIIIALGLLAIELVVWWLTHERTPSPNGQDNLPQTKYEDGQVSPTSPGMQRTPGAWSRLHILWDRMDTRDVIRIFIIRPSEIFNTGWLVYIISAQTFGSYQTCNCLASTWARSGVTQSHSVSYNSGDPLTRAKGYIDFATSAYPHNLVSKTVID